MRLWFILACLAGLVLVKSSSHLKKPQCQRLIDKMKSISRIPTTGRIMINSGIIIGLIQDPLRPCRAAEDAASVASIAPAFKETAESSIAYFGSMRYE